MNAPATSVSRQGRGPRISAGLLDAAVAAAARVLKLEHPADAVLSAFFRAHPKLGQADRAFVADAIYALLRRWRLVSYALAEAGVAAPAPRMLVLAALVRVVGSNVRELEGAARPGELARLEAIKGAARGALPFEVGCDLPDWVVGRLRAQLGDESTLALARALAQPAPLDLRVNLVKAERDEVARALAAQGIAARPTPYSPTGLRVAGRPPVNRSPLFAAGAIEVQDEGSQLLCLLLAPRRGEMVVDFCAGAGGKALALGALMRSTGRVYAFDVSEGRLAKLGPRLARSGLSNVHPQRIDSERDPRVGRLAGKIDRVIVDAPCTGLGTLRRNPDLKWRQDEAALGELASKQSAILAAAATLVKPGGRLLYATCSILAEENEAVAEAFLRAHPAFALVPAGAALAAARVELPQVGPADGFLRLRPDAHGTDAFFGALMERRA
jgi:16S rRNA (cytosine967-C5)-methyltransferase